MRNPSEAVVRLERTENGVVEAIGKADVGALVEQRLGPCVSIFLRRHPGTTGAEQDRIALKNLVREAQSGLQRAGTRRPDALRILQPAVDLVEDPSAWERRSEALILYLASGRWRGFRLPIRVRTGAHVGPRFLVRPLFPILSGDGRFFLLALSQNQVRLLLGTRDHIQEVTLPDVPENLHRALRFDDPEKERLYHVSVREGVAIAVSHGRGIGGEVEKERLTRFLRLVDDGVTEVLRDERAPLVLAGSDPGPAIYRRISRYPAVLDRWLPGNPDHLEPSELHRRAWPLVEPIFRQTRADAAERFRQLAGTGKTSEDVAEIILAATQGRVAVLFVLTEAQHRGTVDEAGRVSPSVERGPDDVDLIETAVVRTFLTGGTVYVMPSEGIQQGAPLAATLRY
jgi:hypothetical protein